MRPSPGVVARLLVLGALAVELSGCAALRLRNGVLEEVQTYSYPRPISELWPQVVAFVQEQGYPPIKGDQQYLLVSDWRSEFNDSRIASSSTRIMVEGRALGPSNSLVRIYKQARVTGGKGRPTMQETLNPARLYSLASDDADPLMGYVHVDKIPDFKPPPTVNRVFSRDLSLEWALLQHLSPEEARGVEARAATR